jgi:hypothetical protein
LESAADSREVALGKGAHSTSTFALEVEYTHPWGLSPTPIARWKVVSGGAARSGGAHNRSASAEYNHVPRVSVKASVPGTVAIGSPIWLTHRPTSPLVGTSHLKECLGRCARVIANAHRPYCPPPRSVSHTGKVRAVFYRLTGAENRWKPTRIRQTRWEERHRATNCGYGFSDLRRREGEA